MGRGYTVTIRREGGVERQRFGRLQDALGALEVEARAFAATERRPATRGFGRTYEPEAIVALRVEVRGGGARGGVDVRGDGSAEAFSGRLARRVIAQEHGESAYDALRRVLGAPSG